MGSGRGGGSVANLFPRYSSQSIPQSSQVRALPPSPCERTKRLCAETSERDIRIEAEPDDLEEGEDTSTPLSTPLRGRIAQLIADS